MNKKNNLKYLNYLINQTVKDITTDISTVIGAKSKSTDVTESIMSVYTQINFSEYNLHIYNKAEVISINDNFSLRDLIGLRVIETREEKEFAELIFDNDVIFRIDLRNEAYNDPEAMCLYGPNNFCFVWN